MNKQVVSIESIDGSIKRIRLKDANTDAGQDIVIQPDDFVFSTLPLMKLPDILSNVKFDSFQERIKKSIHLNDLILIFLKIDKQSLINESWVFVPDPEIVFHRISEQESFDPSMTPGGSIVCCEIMSNEDRIMSDKTDAELYNLVLQGLEKMGYKNFSVIDWRVIRLPQSYPVYKSGFEEELEAILKTLDGMNNFRSIGRQGSFNYIGTLDAMDIGYGAAKWLIESRTHANTWEKERQRTNHYPVLD